jgi:ABC-type multidrug transport system fused ATPase/permease subunit
MILSLTKRGCQGVWLWQYREGRLDAAMVMYLNMLTEQLLASFSGYAGLLERTYDGLEPTRILMKLLEEKPAIQDDPAAAPVAVPEQVGIRMVNIGFAYSRGREVVRGLNLSIPEGQILGVVGRSGCGKTTIQNLLSRMFEVGSGRIEIAGKDIRRWPLEQLRGIFAHVSQSGGVFFSGATVAEVIRFARPEATFREVVHAARCACIHEDVVRMPRKYSTRVGQKGVTLSRGQQQRLALAQALLALGDGRKVLVLDEFTSALDSETEQRILRNLFPSLAGRTVIIIAHRLSTVRDFADRIVVLDEGRIVEEGTHGELIEQGGWYADMSRLQGLDPEGVYGLRSAEPVGWPG